MANNFGSAIGSAISSMIPQITNIAGNWGGGTDTGSAKKLMEYQTKLWQGNTKWYNNNILAHAYKTTRNSLEEAGYNPLMALSNGALYDQGPMPNATANSSAKAFNMSALTKSQVANTNADTMLKGAQTEQATSSANLMNEQKETEKIRQVGEDLNNVNKLFEIAKNRIDLNYYEKEKLLKLQKDTTEIRYMLGQLQYYNTIGVTAKATLLIDANYKKELIKIAKKANEIQQGYLEIEKQLAPIKGISMLIGSITGGISSIGNFLKTNNNGNNGYTETTETTFPNGNRTQKTTSRKYN